jgi:hypothetical protein
MHVGRLVSSIFSLSCPLCSTLKRQGISQGYPFPLAEAMFIAFGVN